MSVLAIFITQRYFVIECKCPNFVRLIGVSVFRTAYEFRSQLIKQCTNLMCQLMIDDVRVPKMGSLIPTSIQSTVVYAVLFLDSIQRYFVFYEDIERGRRFVQFLNSGYRFSKSLIFEHVIEFGYLIRHFIVWGCRISRHPFLFWMNPWNRVSSSKNRVTNRDGIAFCDGALYHGERIVRHEITALI